ncbi:MAG: hypothetical protein V4505_20125 [Pseudomonadota bacterium]
MHRARPVSEASMRAGESRIPELATQAGHAAYQRALQQTGAVVMKGAGGQLVEMRQNGSFRVLKSLPASTLVQAGLVLRRTKKLPNFAAVR